MSTKVLTITTKIDLPDDAFDYAEVVAKCRPLQGVIQAWLTEQAITAAVTHEFVTKRVPKTETPATPALRAGE